MNSPERGVRVCEAEGTISPPRHVTCEEFPSPGRPAGRKPE